MSSNDPQPLVDGDPDDQQEKAGDNDEKPTSLPPLDLTHLTINTDVADHRRRPGQAGIRSVSDVGPLRPPLPTVTSSLSSGHSSPLAQVQAARSGGLGARPPSSSNSSSSALSGGVGKLPAGMQAKMMAVLPPAGKTDIVPRVKINTVFITFGR
jgi:hypothetical protein